MKKANGKDPGLLMSGYNRREGVIAMRRSTAPRESGEG